MDTPLTYWNKWAKQDLNNKYYYEHLGEINNHMAEYDLTFEWKVEMMKKLENLVGLPVKLNWWQRIRSNMPI